MVTVTPISVAAASRSAPQADVAHSLAGGAALCRGEVHLTAGAHAHLVHVLVLGGRTGRGRVHAERETTQLNGAGVQEYLGGKIIERRAGSSSNNIARGVLE